MDQETKATALAQEIKHRWLKNISRTAPSLSRLYQLFKTGASFTSMAQQLSVERGKKINQSTVNYYWHKYFKTIFEDKDSCQRLEMGPYIPDDDLERAKRNLAAAEMKERMYDMPMDGRLNQGYAIQQETSKLYYAGQLPPNNLLNPIAWAEFIKAWQNGDFKRKKD